MTTDPEATATPSSARPTRDRLWTAIIVALVVVGVLILIVPFLVMGSIGSFWPGVQVLLVAVIVAAIRSRK